MSFARHYAMIAASDQIPALERALSDLAAAVRVIPGCEGVEVLRDLADQTRFVFVERWTSMDAHKSSASLLPKSAFAPVMAALGEKPTTINFEPLLSL